MVRIEPIMRIFCFINFICFVYGYFTNDIGNRYATDSFTMCYYQPVMNPSRTRNWLHTSGSYQVVE